MSTPLDPIYCRRCKAEILYGKPLCASCGWDQTIRFDREAHDRKLASEARQQTRRARMARWKKRILPPAQPFTGTFPEQNLHVATELASQYRLLVIWQIVGLLLILDGPILLLFLYFTGLLPIIAAASILFPVAVAAFPTAVVIGLIYAAIRKPALRQRIAEMGVSAGDWARPMERPIRRFWIATVIFTAAILLLSAILSAVRHHQGSDHTRYTQRTSPTLYEWDYQRRRDQPRP